MTLRNCFLYQISFALRKCAETEVTTELAEVELKEKEKMQSNSKEVDDSYVGWITSWWSDENSHADNDDGTSGKDTSMEEGDFSISEKEKTDFFKGLWAEF